MASRPRNAESTNAISDPRLVLDSAPALIHTALPDGYLDFFNESWLRYVGWPMENLLGWNWTQYIHPDDVEGIVAGWRASLASGEPFLYEARVPLVASLRVVWHRYSRTAASNLRDLPAASD